MGLGEIYFYVLTGLVLAFSFFTCLDVEDVKLFWFFKKVFLIGLLVLVIGLLLVFFNLSYLPNSRTIFIYALPSISVLINRMLFLFNNNFFGEPFVYAKGGGFLNGFWYDEEIAQKRITLRNKLYYFYYTVLHFSLMILYLILLYTI